MNACPLAQFIEENPCHHMLVSFIDFCLRSLYLRVMSGTQPPNINGTVTCKQTAAGKISNGNHIIVITANFQAARVCTAVRPPLIQQVQVQVAPAQGPGFQLTLTSPAGKMTACKATQRDSPTTVQVEFDYSATSTQALTGLVFAKPVISSSAPAAATCTASTPSELQKVAILAFRL